MGIRPILYLALGLVLVGDLWPEVKVRITAPELVNIGSVGQDLISEQEIAAFVQEPLGLFELQIADQLRGALGRPSLYQGLADSITLPLLTMGSTPWGGTRFSFGLVLGGGVQSDTFDPLVWADRLRTLRPDADYRFGAAAQPVSVVSRWVVFPGEWNWSVGGFGGLSRLSYAPVVLETASAGFTTSFGYRPNHATWGLFSWSGVSLEVGGGWARNFFSSEVTVPLPAKEVPLDLTYVSNAGTVAITAEPRIRLSLENQGSWWPVLLSTEVAVAQTLRVGLTGGFAWSNGTSALSLSGRNPVHVATKPGGDVVYEKFFGDTAWVDVEGSESGSVAPGWQPVLTVAPSWSVGAFRFGLPLTYRHPGGVGLALAWGLVL